MLAARIGFAECALHANGGWGKMIIITIIFWSVGMKGGVFGLGG